MEGKTAWFPGLESRTLTSKGLGVLLAFISLTGCPRSHYSPRVRCYLPRLKLSLQYFLLSASTDCFRVNILELQERKREKELRVVQLFGGTPCCVSWASGRSCTLGHSSSPWGILVLITVWPSLWSKTSHLGPLSSYLQSPSFWLCQPFGLFWANLSPCLTLGSGTP